MLWFSLPLPLLLLYYRLPSSLHAHTENQVDSSAEDGEVVDSMVSLSQSLNRRLGWVSCYILSSVSVPLASSRTCGVYYYAWWMDWDAHHSRLNNSSLVVVVVSLNAVLQTSTTWLGLYDLYLFLHSSATGFSASVLYVVKLRSPFYIAILPACSSSSLYKVLLL